MKAEFDPISSQINGKKYGYPQCCIDYFVKTCTDKVKSHKDQLIAGQCMRAAYINGNYSGYIPCPAHLEALLYSDAKLEDFIKDRDSSLAPFPYDWSLK